MAFDAGWRPLRTIGSLGPAGSNRPMSSAGPRTDAFVLFVPFVVKKKNANRVGACFRYILI
jgi:hypothetical protein